MKLQSFAFGIFLLALVSSLNAWADPNVRLQVCPDNYWSQLTVTGNTGSADASGQITTRILAFLETRVVRISAHMTYPKPDLTCYSDRLHDGSYRINCTFFVTPSGTIVRDVPVGLECDDPFDLEGTLSFARSESPNAVALRLRGPALRAIYSGENIRCGYRYCQFDLLNTGEFVHYR